MKHYNTKELENLKTEAMKQHDKFSKIWFGNKRETRLYNIFLKTKKRTLRRLTKLSEHRTKIREQKEMLDKSEINLLKKAKKIKVAGRPKKENKKLAISIKLPPELIEWMDGQPESRAKLIENAFKEWKKE